MTNAAKINIIYTVKYSKRRRRPTELIYEYDKSAGCRKIVGVKLHERRRNTHKYDYGCDMIVGGCIGYTGAPLYSAEAASRSGAGLVMLGVPEKIYAVEAIKSVSSMPFPLPCDENGKLISRSYSALESRFSKADALLIGPGMGISRGTEELTLRLIEEFPHRIILDADGINVLSGHIDHIGLSRLPMIITPHAGEFRRIGGDAALPPHIAAKSFSVKHRCITVLKGHRTVIAMPDGEVYINTTGSPALAKGGSGDILSGIILSFIGQGIPAETAVPAAVFIHGLCGDICAQKLHEYSVLPTDIIDALPEALKSL